MIFRSVRSRAIPTGSPGWLLLLVVLAGAGCVAPAWRDHPTGDAVLRAPAGGSEIVLTTTSRVAGAVHSLTWNGREFIDSTDHGRQLQSASNFDAGRPPMQAETFNPTEAGSRQDRDGPTSSSRLEFLRTSAGGTVLESRSRMAFWLAPGERSGGQAARNPTVLSDHLLDRRIELGWGGLPAVIRYDVTFTIPAGEGHTLVAFESLTGYQPWEFSVFLRLPSGAERLQPLSDGPGEQADPVVLATPDGRHAMGIWSPDTGARYGRFRFGRERVVKWNCVFRLGRAGEPLRAGAYGFRHFVVVGDLATVESVLRGLPGRFEAAGGR